MATWGATHSDSKASMTAWQDASVPTASQDLEWGHLSSVYGDVLQWGESSSAVVPREVFLERHYQQQQQVVEQQQHQQQALDGESSERCNILSTFFGDLLNRCVREEEFARTGPVLRQYLQQQQCSALNRAAGFLEGNQQRHAASMPGGSLPHMNDASNNSRGTPAPQFGSPASAWAPKTTPVQRRDAARLSAQRGVRGPQAVTEGIAAGDPLAAFQGSASAGQGFSLRTILKALDHVPTGCVLMAKKFNRLGSNAAAALQGHFGNFGTVRHILVPDVNACQVWQRTGRRRKPANQAFVIMADAAAVDRVLGAQRKHVVQGQLVQVTRFEHHNVAASQPADGEEFSSGSVTISDSVEITEVSELVQIAEMADVSLDKCIDKLAGDGYDRQISSTTADTLQMDHHCYLSSSSGDDRRAGDDGAWSDGDDAIEGDPCEITGDFEYWATDDEGL